MKEIKPAYWGKLQGQPGARHVRELQSRASEPCPDGTARNAPTTGFRGHKAAPSAIPERNPGNSKKDGTK